MINRSTVRKSVAALLGQGFASGTNFLTGIIIGRACTQEEFGQYVLAFSIVVFVMELQNALIATPYMVYAPRLQDAELSRYTGSTFVHQLALTGVMALAVVAVAAGSAWGFFLAELSTVFWGLSAAIGFILLREFTRRICFTHLAMKVALVVDVAVATLQLGGLSLLAYYGQLTPARAFGIIGLAALLVVSVWLLRYRHIIRINKHVLRQHTVQSWTFGKWVFASALLWGICMNIYPWLITAFHGTEATGIWGACFGVVMLGNIVVAGLQNFIGPKIATVYAELGIKGLKHTVLVSAAFFVVPMACLAGLLFFLGGPLVAFLYGPQYAGNGMIVTLLALNLLVLATAVSFSRGLFVLERADIDLAVNFVVLLFLLLVGIWLVRAWGVVGAAWALLLANTAAFLVRAAVFVILIRSKQSRLTL